jgi:flagellar biosynthetic protein FlhB
VAAEDEGKTEAPTGKRLGEAKEKGSVARIQDLQQASTLFVGCLALHWLGASMTVSLKRLMVECFRAIPTWRPGPDDLNAYLMPAARLFAGVVVPVLLLVMLVSIALSIASHGWLFHPAMVMPDPSKAFHFSLSRLFGTKALVELGKALVRMAAVAAIGFQVAWAHHGAFLEMAAWPFATQVAATVSIGFEAVLKMSLVLVVLGIADWLYQRRTWTNDLKMSKQEVKDEARQSEGDPNVKGKIRKLRNEMHRRIMMREVPRATVVVTNPTHYAVALRYRVGEDRAPVVVAKGADNLARRIREIAAEAQVPLVENPPLARALFAQAEPGDEIPADLYTAVAELLAIVLRSARSAPPRPSPSRTGALAGCLALLVGAGFLGACSWPLDATSPALSVTIESPEPGGNYLGGNIVVRAMLRRCGKDSSVLAWGYGRATVISHGFIRDADSNLVQDTAVLRWDTLPTRPDSTDTTGSHPPRDTLRYFADGQQRCQYVVTVGDILPQVDSLLEGPSLDSNATRTILPRSDTFVVAVHPGENALLRFRWHDNFGKRQPRWDAGIPASLGRAGILAWNSGVPGDSILRWNAPADSLVDTTVEIWLSDALGAGKIPWYVRLCTYREEGSVWTGTRTGLTKVALTVGNRAVMVQRLLGFSDIVALDIDPVREGGTLVAVDGGAGILRKWTSTGVPRVLDDSVSHPASVACDIDGSFCWVGGSAGSGDLGILSRVDGASLSFDSLPGPVQAVAVDQNGWNRAWFLSADSGFLGRTTGGKLDTIVRKVLQRPVSLAWDDVTSTLWVADLGIPALIGFDSTGKVIHRITSVYRPVSVWAGGGKVWVADLGDPTVGGPGAVLRLNGSGVVETKATTVNGPRAVVGDPTNPNRAWVADTENGRLVLLNGAVEVVSTYGMGLDRPDAIAIHRGGP